MAGRSSLLTTLTGSPPTETIRSLGRSPALRAGLPASVPDTMTPVSPGNVMSWLKSWSGCRFSPNHAQWASPCARRRGSTSRMVGEGIVNACPPKRLPRVLSPTTRPCVSTSGPPELPGAIAASVWYQSVYCPQPSR